MLEFLKNLFRSHPQVPYAKPSPESEHALLIHLPLSNDSFGTRRERSNLSRLEDRIRAAMKQLGIGELDGHEFGEGQCVIYVYGHDADKLWDAVNAAVGSWRWPRGTHAIKRYGPPSNNVRKVRVEAR
ncbi:MAG: hypothetical protein SFY96_04460 [Planctomycetota bacterium]|nr:hypothetical protein [Planctomycetota bacterium]